MADIRINALATTATTPASDDYLALDGTAQGTRKILATNIANNVTDVILGSSGPSVKSTLSARAPRQGLVFDGTAGATVSGVPAFGTAGYTYAVTLNASSLPGAYIFDGDETPALIVTTAGEVEIYDRVAEADVYKSAVGTIVAGKTYHVVYSRAIGLFINGVNVSGAVADASNYTGTTIRVGSRFSDVLIFPGLLIPLIYNRALSASEVVSLYEAGAPSANDIPGTAAGTAIAASAGVNSGNILTSYTSSAGQWQGTVAVSTSPYVRYSTGRINVGNKFRVSGTVAFSGGTLDYFGVTQQGSGTGSASLPTSNGNFDVTITAHSYQASGLIDFFFAGNGVTVTVTNLVITPLGLLLAPDAAQAGGGLVWYDTSGNAANISWTSGVSWNVPSSRVLGGNWSVSGTYNGTSGLLNIGTGVLDAELVNLAAATDGVGLSLLSTKTGGRRYFIVSSGGTSGYGQGKLVFGDETVGAYMALASTGNLLIGTTTDSANGKLQLATHTTSAGGIGFGTDTSLYRSQTGMLALDGLTGSLSQLDLRVGGVQKAFVAWNGGDFYLGAVVGTTVIKSSNTTALTLDSSQNATFAALVKTKLAFEAYDGATADRWQLYTYTDKTFRWNYNGSGSDELSIDTSGNLIVAGSMRTGTPTGGTASAWKFGKYNTTAPSATGYVEVDIGGTLYKLLAST